MHRVRKESGAQSLIQRSSQENITPLEIIEFGVQKNNGWQYKVVDKKLSAFEFTSPERLEFVHTRHANRKWGENFRLATRLNN